VVGECRPEGPAHEPRFHALKPTLSFNCFLCPLLVQDPGRGGHNNVSAPGVRVCAAPFNLHPV
jgi:hypothetical protein